MLNDDDERAGIRPFPPPRRPILRQGAAVHETYRTLVDVVKRTVRAKAVTYAGLATRLELSERTVKRILNLEQEDFSRLLAIAEAVGLSSPQLMEMAGEARDQVFRLSEEQEALLAADLCAWALFYELQRGRALPDILATSGLPDEAAARCLRYLETLGLLERLPGNQVRLLNRGEQGLLRGGPLQRAVFIERQGSFAASVLNHVIEGTHQGAHLNMSDHWVTVDTFEKFALKLSALFREFRQAAFYDKEVYAEKHLQPCRWLSVLAGSPSIAEEVLSELSRAKA